MSGPRAEMWKTYRFQTLTVRVIQQWDDPYGRPMVRIEAIDGEPRAEGMAEAVFLAGATPIASGD